jgi:hypothetical protein
MAEWFFRKKSKGEVELDPGWDEYFSFVAGAGLVDKVNGAAS